LVPWSAFVLFAAWPSAWRAIVAREAFGETLTPGYFLIRLAVVLLAVLVLLRALWEVLSPAPIPVPILRDPSATRARFGPTQH